MAGRSLRPRASVDYTASTNTSSTPKWLKNTRGLDVRKLFNMLQPTRKDCGTAGDSGLAVKMRCTAG